MTITINPARPPLPLAAKSGGGFKSDGLALVSPPPSDPGVAPPGSSVTIVDGFSSGISAGWTDQGQATYLSAENAVRFDYPSAGGLVYGLSKSYDIQTPGVCFDFEAKLTGGPRGMKFIKVFGEGGDGVTTDGNANVTFGIVYSTGELFEVSQGNGSVLSNDTQFTIRYRGDTGSTPRDNALNIVTSTSRFDPYVDQGWHRFRMYYLFNSGTSSANEVPDGKVRVEIDGVVRLEANGFYNRHPLNPRYFKRFALADYSSAGNPCELFYRNFSAWAWDGVSY